MKHFKEYQFHRPRYGLQVSRKEVSHKTFVVIKRSLLTSNIKVYFVATTSVGWLRLCRILAVNLFVASWFCHVSSSILMCALGPVEVTFTCWKCFLSSQEYSLNLNIYTCFPVHPRGGCSNPLQYSWRENPMHRGACWTRDMTKETEQLVFLTLSAVSHFFFFICVGFKLLWPVVLFVWIIRVDS